MFLSVCLILLLLGALLRRRHRRRAGMLLLCLGWGVLLLAACGPLPAWLLARLQSPYAWRVQGPWAQRNVIILLGAGTDRLDRSSLEPALFAQGRVSMAARLYGACHREGRDCKILISGGDPQHHGQAEAVVYGQVLEQLGIPASDQLIESRSLSTWQNAQFSRPLLVVYRPERTLLVTSGLHLRRSLLYFAHFGIRPEPIRGDSVEASWSVLPLAWNLALTDAALHEYVGAWRYDVYNLLGWNAPRMDPIP
ncbi:YdcF family protein [Dyella sp.]|uniref:YdcF family protein n=1 Tax=Dyella sp. TaxID=1869338 RepID=UPI002ED3A961